jgi:hypothetical protein
MCTQTFSDLPGKNENTFYFMCPNIVFICTLTCSKRIVCTMQRVSQPVYRRLGYKRVAGSTNIKCTNILLTLYLQKLIGIILIFFYCVSQSMNIFNSVSPYTKGHGPIFVF